jgi:hypothetical protein
MFLIQVGRVRTLDFGKDADGVRQLTINYFSN